MAKQSGIDRAIAKVEREIDELQRVLERLVEARGTKSDKPKRTRTSKPVAVEKAG